MDDFNEFEAKKLLRELSFRYHTEVEGGADENAVMWEIVDNLSTENKALLMLGAGVLHDAYIAFGEEIQQAIYEAVTFK